MPGECSSVVQGDLNSLSVATDLGAASASNFDPSAWSGRGTIYNGQNPEQIRYYNLPAAAATRTVGGMGAHWTACTPRQHPKLERSDLFDDQEWDILYTEAEQRIKTNHTLFDDSIPRKFTDQTYIEWSCAAPVLDKITKTVGRPESDFLSLRSQVRCTKLIKSDVYKGQGDGTILGALCKYLKTDKDFLVEAKKYVLCAGAVLNPGILFNSGWDPKQGQLPALGKCLAEQTMTFCQIVLSRGLVDQVSEDPDADWKERVESYKENFPCDPLTFSFSDADPQRLIVDLRWFRWIAPVETNKVTFSKEITGQFGMPQPTFHSEVPAEDANRAQLIMEDMCLVVSKLGGFLPGAEPKFLVPGSVSHICGTTGAGTSKEDSVCDRYGRVWGTADVIVGGCGVTPTGNTCNPTLTAMCFAIAGADKLVKELPGAKV